MTEISFLAYTLTTVKDRSHRAEPDLGWLRGIEEFAKDRDGGRLECAQVTFELMYMLCSIGGHERLELITFHPTSDSSL